MEPQLPEDNLHLDNLVLENLRVPMYKISGHPIEAKVTSVTSYSDHIFVGTIGTGLIVFRYNHGSLWPVFELGSNNKTLNGAVGSSDTTNVYEVTVTSQHVVYFKEEGNKTFLCVHKTFEVLSGKLKPSRMLETKRKAPMAVDSEMGIIVIGGVAWTSSWTSGGDSQVLQSDGDIDEHSVRVVDIATFDVVREFKATDNAIALLRMQATHDHNMLGVADTRTGIRVYDLRQPTDNCYSCLYKVPVDEIRNFYLLDDFVGVFHKFEPNVSFWNMHEQKTILCINIQDQMRQLAQEFLDEDDDMGLYETQDDHVTSVCGVKGDGDTIVIYGTRSGCIFGMSVNTRRKLFNIPCPYGSPEGLPIKKNVQGISFLQGGKLAVAYEKQGLTIMDFSLENPPDRPPTRQMRRPKTS